jgi:hypothetical protein
MSHSISDEQFDLIGAEVVVQNPAFPGARWEGRCIAIAPDPSVIIEQDDGPRLTLPLAWAALAPPPTYDYEAELSLLRIRLTREANENFDELENYVGLGIGYRFYPFRTQGQKMVDAIEAAQSLNESLNAWLRVDRGGIEYTVSSS